MPRLAELLLETTIRSCHLKGLGQAEIPILVLM